jgi:hypoxanthine phosphoribosyltransferase
MKPDHFGIAGLRNRYHVCLSPDPGPHHAEETKMNKMSAGQYDGVAERAELLVGQPDVESALDRMAEQVTERLAGTDPVVLAVMTGGIVVTGLLLPRLDFQLRLEYIHATRYRNTTRGGALEWRHRPTEAIRGQHVLVVDDIFDEGVTMEAIVDACRDDGAAEVQSAVLVEKLRARDCTYRPDVIGMEIPDRYVMGYGLDYKSYFRNAAGIYAVADADCH